MSSEEIKNLRRRLKKARENGKLQEISDCCCNLAAYLSDEEEHEEALKLYKESLTCSEKLGNDVRAALANRMIAEECINLGYFEEALNHVSAFLKYAQDEGDKVEEQRGLVLKGHVHFTQAEYLMDAKPNEFKKVEELLNKSMEAYRKSFAICNTELHNISEREKFQMKARLLQNKSLVLSRQNKLNYAQTLLIRAIKICTKEKLYDTEHICYLSLGDLYLKKGEPQKALNIYDKAFELSHSTQKKRDSLVGRAKTYIVMEEYQQAKSTLKKAYKLKADDEIKKLLKNVTYVIRFESSLCSISDTELKVRKDLYKKLGDTYCELKNYKKGIKNYLTMLSCAQKAEVSNNDLIKCYASLCRAFINDKQYDKALFYCHQEVESLSKWAPEKAYKIYFRIAKLHELNSSEYEEIHFAYLKAKTKAQQFRNCKMQIKCLKKLINIGQTFNKPDLVTESEKELHDLKNNENDSASSCDSDNGSEFDLSTDSENNSEQNSDTDVKDLISDSDIESEEYDRPRERCKRTKFIIKRNEKGETDLHVAAIKGNYKKVKQLIDQGHPVNVRDTAGWTPLHEACNHGYVDIVNILLDFGAEINDKGGPSCDGTTPLHDAAINGQLAVIETLIKRGASTLVLNDASETPLQCLLAWKKNSALDADEEAIYKKIIETLKSPLDSEDIKRHLNTNKNFIDKKSAECKLKKSSSDLDIVDIDEKNIKPKIPSAASKYKETIEFLRGKRQNNHLSYGKTFFENSDDDDDNDCFESVTTKPKSACEEYKEAIEYLRFKPKKAIRGSVKRNSKPALISEHEYVDNCILDNDNEEEYEERGKLKEKIFITQEDEPQEHGKLKEKTLGTEEEELCSQPRKKIKSLPCNDKKPILEKELLPKPWLKSISDNLLEHSKPLIEKNEDEDILKKLLRVTSEPKVLNQLTVTDTLQKSPDIAITVKIFNEKMKIVISQAEIVKLKINWLIQEVLKRHPIFKSPDNFIYLKTENGFLEESDSLNRLVDTEVECVVTKWKTLPLSERYEKMCTITSHPDISSEVKMFGFKHTVQPQVVEMLKKSSETRSLSLSNLKLSSLTLIPICKAIKYETFIHSLDLSNNYFGDKGIELIVKIFEKCIIEKLNVSGCNITSTGVYYFCDALNGMNELTKNGLEVLNLSNNPITEDAVAGINNIIEQLTNLRTLNIDCCELETVVSVSNSTNLVVVQGNKFENVRKGIRTDS